VRYQFIRDHRAEFSVRRMCSVLSVSHGGFYGWLSRPESRRSREDRRLKVEIRSVFKKNKENYGSPRVHRELRQRSIDCGRHRVARLMREEGLQAKSRRAFRVTTRSKSDHWFAPNLLNREFEVPDLNTVWLGDITYLWTREGWLYLAVVMDLCSRLIVGWALTTSLTDDLTLEALNQALESRNPDPGLMHHSDRGSQYTSEDYLDKLEDQGFVISMSRKGNCWDNAPMESFFASFKTELGDRFFSRVGARHEVFQFIEVYYNRKRMHSALDYKSPSQFEMDKPA
jgi:putative transposase